MRKKKKKLIRKKLDELSDRLDNKTYSEKEKQVMKDMMDVVKDVLKACEDNDEEALEKIRQRMKDDDPLDRLIENDDEEGTEKD